MFFAWAVCLIELCCVHVVLVLQVSPEDSARLSALAKDISAAEVELAKLKKSAAGLMEQAEKLQGQIENAGGAKMKKQKQAVADLQQVYCCRGSIGSSNI